MLQRRAPGQKLVDIIHGVDAIYNGEIVGITTVFKTQTHYQIFSVLCDHLDNLSRDEYAGEEGTLVGAKGIGKSICFRNFVYLAHQLVSNVVVVYLDMKSIDAEESVLSKKCLSLILVDELKKFGVVPVFEENRPLYIQLLYELRKSKFRLLLLVDELDQRYRCCSCASVW